MCSFAPCRPESQKIARGGRIRSSNHEVTSGRIFLNQWKQADTSPSLAESEDAWR